MPKKTGPARLGSDTGPKPAGPSLSPDNSIRAQNPKQNRAWTLADARQEAIRLFGPSAIAEEREGIFWVGPSIVHLTRRIIVHWTDAGHFVRTAFTWELAFNAPDLKAGANYRAHVAALKGQRR